MITGADKGLGYCIAETLGCNGYNVCINYLKDHNEINELCNRLKNNYDCKAFGYQANVCHNSELNRMFSFFSEEFGGMDLLINNAGVTKFSPLLKTTEKLWKEVLFTDFKGAYFCTQFAAKNMISHKKGGLIINISSNQAQKCWPEASVYGSAKAALSKFGQHAALELAPYNIRVITLEPGYVDTGWEHSSVLEEIREKIPLQRFASSEEISKIILYLDSESFTYMTGCNISIDGGALLSVVTENKYDSGRGTYE